MASTTSSRRAISAGVIIVSPSLLMLAIQVVQRVQGTPHARGGRRILMDVVADGEMSAPQRIASRIVDKHFGQPTTISNRS